MYTSSSSSLVYNIYTQSQYIARISSIWNEINEPCTRKENVSFCCYIAQIKEKKALKREKKLISEIHILPEIISNENRGNEASGIQKKVSWFCSANFIINVKSCGKWWHVNHISEVSPFFPLHIIPYFILYTIHTTNTAKSVGDTQLYCGNFTVILYGNDTKTPTINHIGIYAKERKKSDLFSVLIFYVYWKEIRRNEQDTFHFLVSFHFIVPCSRRDSFVYGYVYV